MPASKRPVIWSPEARADLEEIWTYYAGVAGRQTADNVTRRIGAACGVIETIRLPGVAGTSYERTFGPLPYGHTSSFTA
jgi:plasmid stabilization system protein ParE